MPKGKLKPKLKLLESEPMPKMDEKVNDELARLIRSINEMGRKGKTSDKNSKQPEPEPPIAA